MARSEAKIYKKKKYSTPIRFFKATISFFFLFFYSFFFFFSPSSEKFSARLQKANYEKTLENLIKIKRKQF